MVEMIHLERSKAELLKKNQPHTETDQQDSARLFTDPLIYIRKWIGEVSRHIYTIFFKNSNFPDTLMKFGW